MKKLLLLIFSKRRKKGKRNEPVKLADKMLNLDR